MSVRILVVDDEDILIRCYRRILENSGYQVDYVNSGLDALKRIEASRFDLIILDYLMPEMNGMEVLRRITELQTDTKVIMVTGLDKIETQSRAKELGVFDYLPKPFDPDDLKRAVERALAN
ncbi:MAG: response regulator [Proteobacteria bacterium]|nr:response regulator [Pseudomonadota bacterium]